MIVSDSIFMDPYKFSDLLGNLNRANTTATKISKEKTTKIKSESARNIPCRLLWITLRFFKFIGLATFIHSVVTQRKRTLNTFRYSRLGAAYNVVLASLLIASNSFSIPNVIHIEYENMTMMTIGIELLQTILGTIVICAGLLSYCVDQKSIVRIANRLMDTEHEIDRLYRSYHPLQRRRVWSILIIACVTMICLFIALLVTDLYAFDSYPISWLTDILPSFHVSWLIMQYFLLITIIQADFADVNRAIQSLSRINTPDLRPQTTVCQTRRVIVSNSMIYQLLQLRDVHCHLCEISEDVSRFYSLSILFGIAYSFLSLIYNAYYLLLPLISDEVLECMVLINTILWLIFLIYPIFLLTNRVSMILNEVWASSVTPV